MTRATFAKFTMAAVRLLFGLFYAFVGVKWFSLHGLGHPETDAVIASTTLEKAMAQTGFMNPLLALGCLLGGGAMLIPRTIPLGITVLAPIVESAAICPI